MTLATTPAGVASPDQMKRDARKSGGLSAVLWPNAWMLSLPNSSFRSRNEMKRRAHRPASVTAEVLSRMAYSCRTR